MQQQKCSGNILSYNLLKFKILPLNYYKILWVFVYALSSLLNSDIFFPGGVSEATGRRGGDVPLNSLPNFNYRKN